MSEQSFTGWVRRRSTSVRVKIADVSARILITVAGVATIVAVAGVCVFLVSVAVPLFLPGGVQRGAVLPALLDERAEPPTAIRLDEYETIGFAWFPDGEVVVFAAADGRELSRSRPFGDRVPTAVAFPPGGDGAIVGFADGTVSYGRLGFEPEFIEPSEIEPEYRSLPVGGTAARGDGVVERTPIGSFRLQRLLASFSEPAAIADVPIRLVDLSTLSTGPVLAAVDDRGVFHLKAATVIRNMMTRRETVRFSGGSVAVEPPAGVSGPPSFCMLEGRGDSALLVWSDGQTVRLDTRERADLAEAERLDLLDRDGATVTAATFMNGKTTLLVADDRGSIESWFRVRPTDAALAGTLRDGSRLVRAHVFPGDAGVAATSLAPSSRTRMFAAGFEDGSARLYYATNDRLLATCPPSERDDAPATAVAISPKDDGLLVAGAGGIARWNVAIPHPQTTFASIFGRVWYEGYEKPEHVWQSSSGTDEFEPKFGLIPLIFGSIKATLYAMLFGTPLALLAAIYTSEFMHPTSRARVKPAIEIMASLPSVVLGFLAALVFAPLVEQVVPAVIACFFAVPFAVLVGGHLWQFLPSARAARLARLRMPLSLAFAFAGIGLGVLLAPWIERTLFGGDVMAWLAWNRGTSDGGDSPYASPVGGWFVILLPFASLAAWLIASRLGGHRGRDAVARMTRGGAAVVQFVRFLVGTLLCLGLAWGIAQALALTGFDPRGGVVDTYVQRNALIVGFMMGFAIIPIIYTIAEDALSSVPEHLRSGSLGLGATPWQTAVRIIVPTAMSGIFSAVMVGLGRAVGETMIVLMAAGNTPILEWNIFNGFRTLSANIAVELPEAVPKSTEFRMLFLAALSLFVLTFLVNTVAEAVRQRFRKRAFAL
ncbi:MAG: ABC transporter permease subunit [Phycisphaerales bacterium]